MKKNWVKGLDRIAIIIAMPIAIGFGIYQSSKYNKNNRLWAFQPERLTGNYMLEPAVHDFKLESARSWGYSDREIIDGFNSLNDSRAPRIEQGLKKGFHLRDLKIISPSKAELFIVGLLWAMGAGIISVLAVSVSTRGIPRTFRWLQNGFASEEAIRNKRK
jgi:hypothetical protein